MVKAKGCPTQRRQGQGIITAGMTTIGTTTIVTIIPVITT
jgi:hypothetical protein